MNFFRDNLGEFLAYALIGLIGLGMIIYTVSKQVECSRRGGDPIMGVGGHIICLNPDIIIKE